MLVFNELRRDDFGFGDILKNENDSGHGLVTKRAWSAGEVETESNGVLQLGNGKFVVFDDFLYVFIDF